MRAAGVGFEVIPGVTAASAAAARAGLALTGRGRSSLVVLATGTTQRATRPAISTGSCSPACEGTLVFYMAVHALDTIAARLTALGRDPDEPALVVERAGLAGERLVTGRLGRDRRHGARGRDHGSRVAHHRSDRVADVPRRRRARSTGSWPAPRPDPRQPHVPPGADDGRPGRPPGTCSITASAGALLLSRVVPALHVAAATAQDVHRARLRDRRAGSSWRSRRSSARRVPTGALDLLHHGRAEAARGLRSDKSFVVHAPAGSNLRAGSGGAPAPAGWRSRRRWAGRG